jgi:hypothetical protein
MEDIIARLEVQQAAGLDEHALLALEEQSDRLQLLLQSSRLQLQRGREMFIVAPSPLSIITDADQLCAIIDLLDDVEGMSLALVCKAFNYAFQRGRRKRCSEFMDRGRKEGVCGLIALFASGRYINSVGDLLASPCRLRWAQALGYQYNEQTAARLACAGALDALKMVVSDGCEWGRNLAVWSAGRGQLTVLQWAAQQGCPYSASQVCEWAATIENANNSTEDMNFGDAETVAKCHRRALEVVQWAMDGGESCAEISAAEAGGAEVGGILERAAVSGNVLLIRWLAEHGGLVNFNATRVWANIFEAPAHTIDASIRCLLDLRVGWSSEASEFEAGACAAACAGCAGPSAQEVRTFLGRQAKGLLHKFESAEVQASMQSNLPLLRRLRQEGFPWDGRTCEAAARAGDQTTLQFVRAGGCDWGDPLAAVLGLIGTSLEHPGHRAVIAWALANGCPRLPGAVHQAAHAGNVEMLQLLLQHGCTLDQQCMVEAAGQGHLDCMKWLHARGLHPDWETWYVAADPSRQLLHEDLEDWIEVVEMGDGWAPKLLVLQWLAEIGPENLPRPIDAIALLNHFLCAGWVTQPTS